MQKINKTIAPHIILCMENFFNYSPPHAHHKGSFLCFLFSVLRDEELKSYREDPLMVRAGSLSCHTI